MGRGSRPERSQDVVPVPVPDPPPEDHPEEVDVDDVDVESERLADIDGGEVAGPIDEPRTRMDPAAPRASEPDEPERPEVDLEPADAESGELDADEPTGRGPEPVPVGDSSRWWEEVDRDAIPEVPDQWRERVIDASFKWERAESFAEDRGMRVEEYLDAVNAHTRQLLADGRLCMFVPSRALRKVLVDGRMKNQHETGTTRGMPGRASFEEQTLGIADPEGAPESAPVYGIACGDPESETHSYLRYHYGETIVVFRDSMRPRATFTVGDSLDENLLSGPTTWVSPVNVPHEGSQLFGGEDPLDAEEVDDLAENYVEVQYWGPVTLGDIEAVYVDEPGLAFRIRDAGVEVRNFLY